MHFIQSLAQILIAYSLLCFMGLGLAIYCLPVKYRVYSFHIAPTVGYVAFCFLSIWISGLTNDSVLRTNLAALSVLVALSTIALLWYRSELSNLLQSARMLLLLIGTMLVVVFLPVLLQGVDLYLGTVNPDFYQSLSLHEVLVKFDAKFWVRHTDLPLAGPFLEMFPSAFQARFGGVVFSVLLEQLFNIPSRAALMLSIVVFVMCLPTAVYFFCSTVLEFNKKESTLSAVLVAISAPTAMSFIHALVGQNSALATFPLAISLIYLALKERSISLIFLVVLMLNGMFWIYVMALPFVLAPLGFYGAIKLFRQNGRELGWWLFSFCLLAVVTAAIHFSIFGQTMQFISDLIDLLRKVAKTRYYADFLTEEVFFYATGLSSYTLSQSLYFHSVVSFAKPILVAVGILLAVLHVWGVRLWSKTSSHDAVLMVSSLLITYIAVWAYYTFISLYGYAAFKMSAWLQFLVTPFFAWYILRNWEVLQNVSPRVVKWQSYLILVLLVPVYVGLNLASDLDYGIKSFGRDRFHGSLINSYGIGDNRDFVNLPETLKQLIPKNSTVALGFGDSIENFLAAYYVGRSVARVSILTHEEQPLEDAHLPDIHSRKYLDALGQPQIDKQQYLYNGLADYYLLAGHNNLNNEIIDGSVIAKPLWSNDTFALYKKADIKDLIRTGRGFDRAENMDVGNLAWWWPETFRWSTAGGEIYHFFPSLPGVPYRIEFSTIAGLGQSSGQRTIELWHNGKKFDEVVVRGAARFISQPYYPFDGINRIVLKIKEKSVLVGREGGLWNRDIPRRATPINALFSNIKISKANELRRSKFPLGIWVEPKEQFKYYDSFNGFDVDGWVRDRASFRVSGLPAVTNASFRLLIPGNLNFNFPYRVRFLVNGKVTEKIFEFPGEYIVELNLLNSSDEESIDLELVPDEARLLANGMTQREVLQSIRLSAVKIANKEKEFQ